MTSNLLYHRKANGKLLITGEYYVLDGAKALACPTLYGQILEIHRSEKFSWKSFDHLENLWLNILDNTVKSEAEKKLLEILTSIDGFQFKDSYKMTMDFPRNWGLGSSSTLIALQADYFQVNPYMLNDKMFQGSGYDIACAFSETPILYSNENKLSPEINTAEIPEAIKPYCYFAYLNKKQDSREGINHYHKLGRDKMIHTKEISEISEELLTKSNYLDWIYLLSKHEDIISNSLNLEKVSNGTLKNFPYFTKSLGAWGGDFVMIISDDSSISIREKARELGFDTFFTYNELLLSGLK